MRISYRFPHRCLALVAWLFAWSAAPVAAQSARVELSAASGSAEAGTVAEVPIRILSSIGLGAVQFEIIYDPEVIRFKGLKKGLLLPESIIESNLVQPGRVRVGLVSPQEVKGVVVLLTAEFEMLAGPTTTTSIDLEAVRSWDREHNLPVGIVSRSSEWTRTGRPDQATSRDGSWIGNYGLMGVLVLVTVAILLLRRRSLELIVTGR